MMISEIRDSQNKETLIQRLGIFELRGLAREMGIPSPTTKKRDELVSLICDGLKNGSAQEGKTQKRGRPFKKLASLEEIISSVTTPENKGEVHYDTIIKFAQEEYPVFSVRGETERIEGVVRKSEKNTMVYALSSPAKVFVGDIYASEKLENGDVVELTAQDLGEDNYQALSLSLINGSAAAAYQPCEAQHGEEVISTEEVPCENRQIIIGRRNSCLMSEDLYENNQLLDLSIHAKLKNSTLILLGTNTSYENQIYFKKLGIKYNFTTPYGTSPLVNLNKTINALHLAENSFNRGETVLLVVTDLGGLLLGLDENFEKGEGEHAKETQVIAKKLLSLAGAYSTKQNFTLVLFHSEIDKDDKFLYGDLLRICKKA